MARANRWCSFTAEPLLPGLGIAPASLHRALPGLYPRQPHGRTDNPTGELGYRVMADDVAALVGALDLQRPLMLGYSDGGQIALELGMRYSGLARALVLGGTQFRFSVAYLEDARALLGIAEGEEVDPELEREQPTLLVTCARRTATSTARNTGRRT